MRTIKYIYGSMLCLVMLPALASTDTLSCASENNAYTHCKLSEATMRDIRIKSVSSGDCTSDNAWGVDASGIWVSKGCSAVFEYSQVSSSSGSSSSNEYYEDGPEIMFAPGFVPYYGPGYYYGAGYYKENGWTENNYYCNGHSCSNNQQHENPNTTHPNHPMNENMQEYHPEGNYHGEENYHGYHGGAGAGAGGFHGGGGGRR